MDVKNAILKSLDEIGLQVEFSESLDIDLRDYIFDSLSFISFVIELENILSVEIPPEMLTLDHFSSMSNLCEVLNELICKHIEQAD